MLVLTRKANQQIRLGEDITITVLRINNGSIRLGIDAPRDVKILRSEIEIFTDEAVAEEAVKSDSAEQRGADGKGATRRPLVAVSRTAEASRAAESGASESSVAAATESESGKAAVYQLRGKLNRGRLQLESAEDANGSQPAPLARFLPPIPPAIRERSSSYSA